MKSADQVINGIMKYADAEVMTKLPTSGKWVMGTVLALASNKIDYVVDALVSNSAAQMLGIVDEDDQIDTDAIIQALKTSADKYGKVSFDIPLVGTMTFSSEDIESLKRYI